MARIKKDRSYEKDIARLSTRILEERIKNYEVITDTMREIMSYPYNAVEAISKDDEVPIYERALASIWMQICKKGCYQRMDFILDRLIGKVPSKIAIRDELVVLSKDEKNLEERVDVYEVIMDDSGKFKSPKPRLVSPVLDDE